MPHQPRRIPLIPTRAVLRAAWTDGDTTLWSRMLVGVGLTVCAGIGAYFSLSRFGFVLNGGVVTVGIVLLVVIPIVLQENWNRLYRRGFRGRHPRA